MKKLSFFCILLLSFFICTACGSSSIAYTKSDESKNKMSKLQKQVVNKDELKCLFQKWDTSMVEDDEKDSIIEKFGNYLKENPNITKLGEISNNFIINNLTDISIISYIETPKIYGESGKLSYTWIVYHNVIKLIFNCDSKEIEDIIQDSENKNIYYVIGRDYTITNCTGVFASRITVGNNIGFEKDIIELEENDVYSKHDGVLYGKSPLRITGNTDGTQLNIMELNKKNSLKLYLTKDKNFKN